MSPGEHHPALHAAATAQTPLPVNQGPRTITRTQPAHHRYWKEALFHIVTSRQHSYLLPESDNYLNLFK